MNCHFYADDSQIYIPCNTTSDIHSTAEQIEHCLQEVKKWMSSNKLKLNDDKSEFMVFGSKFQLKTLSDTHIKMGSAILKPSQNVKNLGVYMDSHLNMRQQIQNTCKCANINIRKIGRIRRHLTTDSTKSLINALVTSRLDYANALLYGIPQKDIYKLQKIQNTCARLITFTPRMASISPILHDLHWLPINKRLMYKILTHVSKSLHNQSPKYIKDLIDVHQPSLNLRYQHKFLLQVPKANTKHGERAFGSAAAKTWNSLPLDLRSSDTFTNFKKKLKTYLFNFHN